MWNVPCYVILSNLAINEPMGYEWTNKPINQPTTYLVTTVPVSAKKYDSQAALQTQITLTVDTVRCTPGRGPEMSCRCSGKERAASDWQNCQSNVVGCRYWFCYRVHWLYTSLLLTQFSGSTDKVNTQPATWLLKHQKFITVFIGDLHFSKWIKFCLHQSLLLYDTSHWNITAYAQISKQTLFPSEYSTKTFLRFSFLPMRAR